jgi:UDP-N-acetylmuramoyl-tripeptide--D-alanyl-D-alanine ligase
VLASHRPVVVAISGSVGKTSTKDAVACVLAGSRRTLWQIGNQNDELGVPLSIVGRRPSGRNPIGWIATLRRAEKIARARPGTYAECLVLEFGSCHQGDVEYLMELAPPDVGVLTGIEVSHLDSYGSFDAIEREERKIVTMLPPQATAVVNVDSDAGRRAVGAASCSSVTYGIARDADVRGRDARSWIDWAGRSGGVTLEVESRGEHRTLTLEGALGTHSCYAPLAALGVALAVGLPFDRAAGALGGYTPPSGRMRCVPGLAGALVIDDTYNSSPAALERALETLAEIRPGSAHGMRRAVLGPMSELARTTTSQHEALGRRAAALGIDRLCTVGDTARAVAHGARTAGMPPSRVTECRSNADAIGVLQMEMRSGDVVLVKGSRESRMDAIVAAVTA